MWTAIRFLCAFCLAYFVRRLFQRGMTGPLSIKRYAILPNLLSGVLIFAVLSFFRYWASDGNYTLHVTYTLVLVGLGQAVWLLFDIVRAHGSRTSRR